MSYSPPPFVLPTPPVISSASRWSAWYAGLADGSGAAASATSNVAFEAIYVPFVVSTPATFTRGFWITGTLPDGVNVATVGIYDTAQARLAVTPTTIVAGASVLQSVAFSASVALTPGLYYMAWSNSVADANGITAFGSSIQRGRVCGLYRQAVGSHPLPATAAFATWTTQVLPYFGIAQTSFAL